MKHVKQRHLPQLRVVYSLPSATLRYQLIFHCVASSGVSLGLRNENSFNIVAFCTGYLRRGMAAWEKGGYTAHHNPLSYISCLSVETTKTATMSVVMDRFCNRMRSCLSFTNSMYNPSVKGNFM